MSVIDTIKTTNIIEFFNEIENLEKTFNNNNKTENITKENIIKMSESLHYLRMIHGSFIVGLNKLLNNTNIKLKNIVNISVQTSFVEDLQKKITDLELIFDKILETKCEVSKNVTEYFNFKYENIKSPYNTLLNGCKLVNDTETEFSSEFKNDNEKKNEKLIVLENKINKILNTEKFNDNNDKNNAENNEEYNDKNNADKSINEIINSLNEKNVNENNVNQNEKSIKKYNDVNENEKLIKKYNDENEKDKLIKYLNE